jgi:hypothetical protein
MTLNRSVQTNSSVSATPNGKSGLSVTRDARLVSSMGPLLPGDKVIRIKPPLLDEISWLGWKNIDGTKLPRPTIGAPEHGFVVQAYFPPNTVKKPASTAVYTLAPGSLAPGTQVSLKTDCILQHDLDMNASQITAGDPGRVTRRGMSYGDHVRDTAYATIASRTMALRGDLPQGGDQFHLTLDPTQTGRKSMRGVTMSRDGQSVCAEEGINHVYYKFKDGIVTEWDSDDDESTIKSVAEAY